MITGPVLTRLHQAAARLDVSLFDLLLAVYALLLSKAAGQEECIIGTTLAGRDWPGLNEIIGVFVTPLPIKLRCYQESNWMEYVRDCSEVMRGFHEHQQFTLEELVEQVPAFRDCDLNDTFCTYILMQNYQRSTAHFGGLQCRPLELGHLFEHALMRDFELIIEPALGGIAGWQGTFAYDSGLFSRELVVKWRMWFEELLDRTTVNSPLTVSLGALIAGLPGDEA